MAKSSRRKPKTDLPARTLAEDAQGFVAALIPVLKPETVDRYRRDVELYVRGVGHLPFTAVPREHARAVIATIEGEIAKQRWLKSVNVFAEWCVRSRGIPTGSLPRVPEDKFEPDKTEDEKIWNVLFDAQIDGYLNSLGDGAADVYKDVPFKIIPGPAGSRPPAAQLRSAIDSLITAAFGLEPLPSFPGDTTTD